MAKKAALRGIAARRAQLKIDEELRNSRGGRPEAFQPAGLLA
jgi:hypothetical protein